MSEWNELGYDSPSEYHLDQAIKKLEQKLAVARATIKSSIELCNDLAMYAQHPGALMEIVAYRDVAKAVLKDTE